jgi:primary-amine oxidase
MPVDYAGFTLKPVGFFDRNPTLDVPASTAAHCHPAGHTGHDHSGHEEGGHDHSGHDHAGHAHH